jgi:hypothetical protein
MGMGVPGPQLYSFLYRSGALAAVVAAKDCSLPDAVVQAKVSSVPQYTAYIQ